MPSRTRIGELVNPRQKRLEADYRELKDMYASDPNVEIVAVGPAPSDKYRIIYRVPAFHLDNTGNPILVKTTVVDIELPMGYPKIAPIAKTVAGDIVFHPNFNEGKICLMDNWFPTAQITDLVREIGDMLQWKKYNIRAPLNAVAAEWSQKNQKLIPIGKYEIGVK